MSTPISSSTSGSTGSSSTTGTSSGSTGSTSSSSSSAQLGQSALAPPLQFYGLVSGMNSGAIINQLLTMFSLPMTQIQQDQTTLSTQQSAWQDIQTQMNALQTAIQNLQAPAAVANTSATVTPPSGSTTAAVSATSSASAAPGTFTVNVQSLATTGTLTSGSSVSSLITQTAATNTALVNLGLGIPATTGVFTINGTQITVDSQTTMLGSSGSDSIQAKLASAGVTLTPTINGSSQVTGITITSATPIQLGAASDTSNVLSALHLTSAVPTGGGTSIASNGSINGINLGTSLSSDSFAGGAVTSGTLNINGTAISYTASTDTLGSLISKINSSAAGVTATYDPLSDKISLTANSTGGGGIAVSDSGGGNISSILGLTGGVSNPGMPAEFTISGYNNGSIIASQSNTVANVVPGVTLNLQNTSPSMTQSGATTVNIQPSTTSLTTSLQSFVTAYNNVIDTVNKYSQISMSNGSVSNSGVLSGDPNLQSLLVQMDQIVNDTTVSINGNSYSLSNLGISTGIPGTYSAGQVPTLDLSFNASTAQSALTSTPTLGQAFIGNGSISSQSGTLFQNLNNLVNTWTAPLGIIGSSIDSLTTQFANDSQQLQNWQTMLQQQRQYYTSMFTNMESTLSQLQAQGNTLNTYLNSITGSTSSSSGSSSGSSSSKG